MTDRKKSGGQTNEPASWIAVLFFALLAIVLLVENLDPAPTYESIAYSQFKQLVQSGQVTDLKISPTTIQGRLTNRVESAQRQEGVEDLLSPLPTQSRRFMTVRVEDVTLVADLEKNGITYSGQMDSSWFTNLLSWLLPVVVLIVFWGFMLTRFGRMSGGTGSGLMTVGKSRAKVYVEDQVKVHFDEVAGLDEAKAELQEVVEFLQIPEKFRRLGGKVPKGVLLVGAPGTGKTLLAKAVAGEAKVPFFSLSGSEFVEMFVGVGAARVRDLFQQALQKAPCIVFIDELDALGKARGVSQTGGHEEREQTLNQLLVEMDGFDPNTGVIIMAATNRPEILDPALLRAGRFDRHVALDRPDVRGREAILRVHAKTHQARRGSGPQRDCCPHTWLCWCRPGQYC